MTMELSDLDFELPENLIAQNPCTPRDHSRLLVCTAAGRVGRFQNPFQMKEEQFLAIEKYLRPGDLLIRNDAKVLPVRLMGSRLREDAILGSQKGGEVEALLLRPDEPGPISKVKRWKAILSLSARVRSGLQFEIGSGNYVAVATCLTSHEERQALEGEVTLEFSGSIIDEIGFESWLLKVGQIPLPPYIERSSEDRDRASYQTVYAKNAGSAAAPTAGFHFTDDLLNRLLGKGVGFEQLTLHIGLGTFRPIKVSKLSDHKMHSEMYEVTDRLAHRILETKKQEGRIVAVGTTVVRALESWWIETSGKLFPGEFHSKLFITPGFEFHLVDDLITNFHLPKSTLLALVAAACHGDKLNGTSEMKKIYSYAVKEKFRFFSYGDALFLRGTQ